MIDPALVIRETGFWTWSLFPNQSYLGRVQFTLRRDCTGSLADLDDSEWTDLRAGLRAYEALAGEVFAPDRFNYVQLGNVWPQIHVHAIPRYREPRDWAGTNVTDTRWGDVPLPEPDNPLTTGQTAELASKLRDRLNAA